MGVAQVSSGDISVGSLSSGKHCTHIYAHPVQCFILSTVLGVKNLQKLCSCDKLSVPDFRDPVGCTLLAMCMYIRMS